MAMTGRENAPGNSAQLIMGKPERFVKAWRGYAGQSHLPPSPRIACRFRSVLE